MEGEEEEERDVEEAVGTQGMGWVREWMSMEGDEGTPRVSVDEKIYQWELQEAVDHGDSLVLHVRF